MMICAAQARRRQQWLHVPCLSGDHCLHELISLWSTPDSSLCYAACWRLIVHSICLTKSFSGCFSCTKPRSDEIHAPVTERASQDNAEDPEFVMSKRADLFEMTGDVLTRLSKNVTISSPECIASRCSTVPKANGTHYTVRAADTAVTPLAQLAHLSQP